MLKTGTTTVCDMVEAASVVDGCLDKTAEAIEKLGSRAVVCCESTERISKENSEAGINENVRFFKKWQDVPDSRISGRIGVHTAFTASEEMLAGVRGIATDLGAGLVIQSPAADAGREIRAHRPGRAARRRFPRPRRAGRPLHPHDGGGDRDLEGARRQGLAHADEQHAGRQRCRAGGGHARPGHHYTIWLTK